MDGAGPAQLRNEPRLPTGVDELRNLVATLIPRDASHRLRKTVQALLKRRTIADSLANRVRQLNAGGNLGHGNWSPMHWSHRRSLSQCAQTEQLAYSAVITIGAYRIAMMPVTCNGELHEQSIQRRGHRQ